MSKAKKTKQQAEEKSYNIYKCECCNDEMELPQFKEHLKNIHGIDPEKLKANRQMIMHIDGAEFYSSTFKWTLDSGLTFHQYCQNKRAKFDPY